MGGLHCAGPFAAVDAIWWKGALAWRDRGTEAVWCGVVWNDMGGRGGDVRHRFISVGLGMV